MLSYRLVLYYDICIVSLKYFFYLRHFKLDFFLHYITLHCMQESRTFKTARFLANVNSPSRSLYHRPSVCLSVCRLSVTFVHPTQATEIFGTISTPFGTLAICAFGKNFTEIVTGEHLRWGVKHKRGSRI